MKTRNLFSKRFLAAGGFFKRIFSLFILLLLLDDIDIVGTSLLNVHSWSALHYFYH